MAYLNISNVSIVGLSASVPLKEDSNYTSSSFETRELSEKFISTTGIKSKRISSEETTSSDLCFYAASKLIEELEWEKNDIDCLVFVSQTPDYILPATSCILQDRLNLSENCYTLDISLGCSGWVYAASVISSLLSSGTMKKGLLLAGDTISKITSQSDKSTYPLFGDSGTATAFQYDEFSQGLQFHLASDGAGFDTIMVPDGGYRNLTNTVSIQKEKIEDGIERNRLQLMLNGMDVFSFGISKAPQTINNLIDEFSINKDSVDFFIFHQANKMMNEMIRKKLRLPSEKVPYSLENFGNTSCASIPLTMVSELKNKLRCQENSFIACGFGVGLSWGSVYFKTNRIICSDLIEI